MNYKIAVCDDSEADRQYISGLVSRWAANSGHTVQITRFPSAENFLFHYAEESDYDMLLLDIEMDVNNGELVPSARSNCTTLPKQEYRLAGWLYRSATAPCRR